MASLRALVRSCLAWIRFQPNCRRLQIWRDALAAQGAVVVEESTRGLTRNLPYTGLRRAVRQAVAEIQSRLPGASPGQLSLTEDEAGRLSLASDSAGQLSLPADEPGQLSLSGGGEKL